MGNNTKKKALLVAISASDTSGYELSGALENAKAMRALLEGCGFDPGDIKDLNDVGAKHDEIVKAAESLVADSQKEEQVLVLAVSAHGSMVGGEHQFFPYDVTPVRDSELVLAFCGLGSSSRLYCFFDCCSASWYLLLWWECVTLFRKFVAWFSTKRKFSATCTSKFGDWVVVRAAMDGETASYPGGQHGLFTKTFVAEAKPGLTLRQVWQAVNQSMPASVQRSPHPIGPHLNRKLFS